MKGKILVVDDERLIRWSLKKDLSQEGYEVLTAESAAETFDLLEEHIFDIVLLDIRLPDGNGKDVLRVIRRREPETSVIMITANDDVKIAVACMQLGAYTYINKPFEFDQIRLNLEKIMESRHLKKRVMAWEQTERGKYDFDNIVAVSKKMKIILEMVKQVAASNASTVLLEGESGTGKDLIARIIHYASDRSNQHFMAVNCAALPATLLESELFGHEKGAFTDARQARAGLVEEANGGTLFLDEIGDMQKELQAKLLHLIDQKKFRRVGGVKELESDIRIVAATNKDLKKEVSEGRFREDLYYRLNVIPIFLPPLRERREDIPELISFFIAHFNREFKKNITSVAPEVKEVLSLYDWPGNIREVKNILERAMILIQGNEILLEHLPVELDCSCQLKDMFKSRPGQKSNSTKVTNCLVGIPLEEIEKRVVEQTLESVGGNQSQAARLLQIGRDALRYKLKKFGIDSQEDHPKVGETAPSEKASA
ncbi:MAG: DNA-binding response regulator [Candidatus Omnitrophica bacterium CG11_big_fil_rev_8_21_14_0_20_45_26]|uniref:DNA-binding response regulator n=1 Tax=Candidatus Abzuiibacterium crystallinum TaxID=1974748 RepID=A0A2H0LRF9_9BACT|nr:MAG: DNA-binding response regulator [Candidatus Omnitrophica bacterium CG11_big_fil_rev_8_21_14_0_20_45_26]PIW65696.1 MAG: DNA-binding response regulator [Candidatus Omnitrophica bacterium CG12_big_fil_rev_8_21_14_0_65_45_16]